MNPFNLHNKRALITGGGTGIGLAIAKAFATAGASVIITGRREDVLRTAATEIGNQCQYHAFDLTNLPAIPTAVEEISNHFGPIDILVNNAGIHQKKPTLEVTDDEFARIQQTNLLSLFALSREIAKSMATRKTGCILNITSMASLYGIPRVAAYTAAKSAVAGLTQQLAVELAPSGIRVNAIAPGFIYSEMSAKALDADPERKSRVMSRTPMARMGRAEEVATAAVFLCSDAASYITGVQLPVDGGNSIGF